MIEVLLKIVTCCLAVTTSTNALIEFHITEELPLGSFVGDVKKEFLKSKGDITDESKSLTFRLIPGQQRYLKLDRSSGILSVNSRIDRDNLCNQRVTTCCMDDQSKSGCHLSLDITVQGGLFVILKVKVYVKDINDNSPKWNQVIQTLTAIEEEATQNLSIPAAQDPDLDVNGTLTYELKDNYDGTFRVLQPKASDSTVTLQVLKRLDREEKSSYSMVLFAKDGSDGSRLTGSLTLTVSVRDVNDHAPIFEKSLYSRDMLENSKEGDFVIRVHATDRDESKNSEIIYEMDSSSFDYQNAVFRLDRKSGNIDLIGRLNYETKKQYKFKVVARDSGQNPKRATADVLIDVKDVNDCPPKITVRDITSSRLTAEISVMENDPPGENIALVSVSDEDSGPAGQVECYLESANYQSIESLFKLKPMSDGVSGGNEQYLILVTMKSFDREEQSLYRLGIKCVDKGASPLSSRKSLTIKIKDQNDNAPVFRPSSYTFYVKESSLENHLVGTVSATDKDNGESNQIQFHLVPSAQDNNASDQDSRLKYVLTQRDIDRYFHIDSRDGRILLRNKLDREEMQQMNFAVRACDGSPSRNGTKSSTANVVVVVTDVNDNQPQFSDSVYHFTLKENVGPGFVVGNISAFDLDENENARLTFKIEKLPDSNLPFMIHKYGTNGNTAKIITSQSIDRERMRHTNARNTNPDQYVFKVVVTDDGQSQQSNAVKVIVDVLDVNDRAPEWVFPSRVNMAVNVSRYARTGHNVAIIKAIDQDAGNNAEVHYSIISGNSGDLFVLDPQKGDLKFRREVDSQDQRVFNLVLRASDNPGGLPNETLSNTTVLKITLIEIPDANGGRGSSNSDLASSNGRSLTVIILLIGSTGVVVFILIMVIILAKVVVYRRNRNMKKGSQLRRGPSTMSRLSSAGNPYPPETVFSTTHTRSQSGHTLSDINKHEIVYYSAEELDRDVTGMSRDPSSHMMTQSETLSRDDGRIPRGKVASIEGMCDTSGRGGWLATTRTSGQTAGPYDTAQYHQLNMQEYTKLARIRNDMHDHYYDFVRHNKPTDQENDKMAAAAPGTNNNQQQPLININTLHRRSLSNLEKKALLNQDASQTLNWRHGNTPRELAEMPPLLSSPPDENCCEENEIKKLTKDGLIDRNTTLTNYRLKSKHSPYQASFV